MCIFSLHALLDGIIIMCNNVYVIKYTSYNFKNFYMSCKLCLMMTTTRVLIIHLGMPFFPPLALRKLPIESGQ